MNEKVVVITGASAGIGAAAAGLLAEQGMSLVLTGLLVGFVAALFVGRLLSSMLFGVGATDPVSHGVAALMLSAVALVACYLPARRATRVDPLVALREA